MSKHDTTYNGWANYETWVTKLWMDNSEGECTYWGELAELMVKRNEPPQVFAEIIKEIKEESMLILPNSGWLTDLVQGSIDNVNWYEIAESLMEDNRD